VGGLVFRQFDSIHIGGGDFSLRYQIHTGSAPRTVLYPPDTGKYLPGGKACVTWS